MEKIVKGTLTYLKEIENIDLKNKKSLFLMLAVPPVCNYRCKKCFNSITSRQAKDLLTLEEILRIIEEGKEIGIRNINILGEGEPLVYKNIKEVVKYIDKLGMILTIATNGRMLNKDMADFLHKHNVIVGISLDTLNEKDYVSYCGGNADLKEVLKNIDYIRKLYSKKIYEKNGYKIYSLLLHMTVTPKYFDQMEKLEDFCKNDIYFDCQPLTMVGRAKKNASFFKDNGNGYENFQKFGYLTKPPMILSKGDSVCSLFNYGIFICRNGDVILDASVKESLKYIGNIKEHSLKELSEKRNALKDFYLKNYHISGYCPIRENTMKKFRSDLKKSKYKF